MKRALFALFAALFSLPLFAQTVANGPYYATPSWDQTLPAAQRFIVLANFNSQSVLDRETGLVWERTPIGTTRVWFSAQTYCNTLTVGSRKGWRLPTIQEFMSLVDMSVAAPSVPFLRFSTGHPFVASGGRFWTANTASNNTGHVEIAWTVETTNGDLIPEIKSNTGPLIWCVRGGQGVDPQ
jgi:hypothetical protein